VAHKATAIISAELNGVGNWGVGEEAWLEEAWLPNPVPLEGENFCVTILSETAKINSPASVIRRKMLSIYLGVMRDRVVEIYIGWFNCYAYRIDFFILLWLQYPPVFSVS
jgi:hypothetical protein